jgi:Tfp pilus assembly protein PilZ
MNKNLERRKSVRIDHIAPLKVKNLKSGKIYKARMFNYSKNGLYFETDSVLHTGDQIYIGIQDSPYAASSGVLEYYRAEIMWGKKLKNSYFEYGYGIQFHAACDKQSQKTNDFEKREDIKKNKKEPLHNTIKVIDHNKTYDGVIKDISSSGVFFEADDSFEKGQILTFAVPLKNGKKANIKGQIVWADDEGFGVIFMNNS